MKQNYFGKLLFAGALFVGGSLQAQKTDVQKQAMLQKIKADNRVTEVQLSADRETPSLIKLGGAGYVSRSQAQQQLAHYLGVRQGVDELRNIRVTDGGNRFAVQEWKQYFKGIPVEKAMYKAVIRDENTLWMAGSYYDVPTSLNVRPALTQQQALNFALQRINARKYAWQQVQEIMNRVANADAASRQKLQQELDSYQPKGELVIVKDFTKTGIAELHLAYKFNIYAAEPLSRDWIYVEANTGKIIFKDPIIKHASINTTVGTRYAGNRVIKVKQVSGNDPNNGLPLVSSHPTSEPTYLPGGSTHILVDDTRGQGIETYDLNGVGGAPISLPGVYAQGKSFTDVNNNWTAAEHKRGMGEGGAQEAENDDIAFDAHWGAEIVYDYWKAKHERLSYDNTDTKIFSFVHYGPAYDNAFWNGTAMTYGDGSGMAATGFKALTSLDVCGHEIGHGVCSFTSDLVYEKESGAMNEGFSDIWAACVENFAIKTVDATLATRYKPFFIGEQISFTAVPLRRMDAPKITGNPDTYGGVNFTNPNCTPTLANDQCGVHNNSGLLNKWFYLMTCGSGNGSGPDASYVVPGADDGINDLNNAYSVTGVGFEVAEDVAYLTELLLTSTATFAEARLRSIEVATAISGNPCSDLVRTVTNSWYAIGVGAQFVAPCVTTFGFVSQSATAVSEGSATGIGCLSQRTIALPVLIPANGTIMATLGGTATRGEDYTVSTTSFTNTGVTTKVDSVVVIIKNDAIVESLETITVSLATTGAGSNPVNNSYTINVSDNDVVPTIGKDTVTILTNTFTAADGFGDPAGFTEVREIPEGVFNAVSNQTPNGKNQWAISMNQLAITGKIFATDMALPGGTYNPLSASQTRIATNTMLDARGLNDLRVRFNFTVQGEIDPAAANPNDPENFPKFDYLALAYSFDGVNYTEIATDSIQRLGSLAPTTGIINAPLPNLLDNQQFYLAFRWNNDANAGGPISVLIDNLTVKGLPKKIETTLGSSITENLVATKDAYFYSQQDGDIIARINQTSAFNYGCVSASLEKAGSSVFDFYTEGSVIHRVGDKVVRITPATNSSTGSNSISIYFTEQEIAAIETATITNRSSFFMYKTTAAAFTGATAANTQRVMATYTAITSNGTPVGGTFTATFNTGFSAFAIGVARNAPLPVTCTGFTATQKDGVVNMLWKVGAEVNNKLFEIERSIDGINFSVIATIMANAQNAGSYGTTDSKTTGLKNAYYRLRQYDMDGRSTYICQTVNVRFGKTATTISGLYPNPVSSNGFVTISTDKALRLQADFINVAGQTIRSAMHHVAAGNNTLQVLKSRLPAGTYLLRFTDNETGAIIKTQTLVQQ